MDQLILGQTWESSLVNTKQPILLRIQEQWKGHFDSVPKFQQFMSKYFALALVFYQVPLF